MTCDEIQQLLPCYVTGVLDGEETSAVRAHLATGCPSCLRALSETESAYELFAVSLIPMEPSPRIKEKLMASVGGARANDARPAPRRQVFSYAMAACIGLIIGGAGVYLALARVAGPPDGDRTQQLQAALAERDSHIEQLNNLLGSSTLNLVELAGQKSPAHGHILYDPANHDWRIYVFDMEPPPLNHIYELWAITTDNKKIPAGTFTVDAHGFAAYSGKVPGNVAAAAITDEPAPGTASPTGTICLLGKISGT